MRNPTVFKLNRQALIATLISAAFPVVSNAAAGRVEFAIGNVTASGADGQERSLTKGAEINSGDTIQTANGRTQIKFTDGGYMSLQPNTQFKVDDYAYEGKADGSEKGFFKLIKGGLRAITGAIGHTNKATYSINTPVATIGIRGTELTGEYSEEGDSKKLVVHVSHGSVFLQNGGGDLILFQGQSGAVTDNNQQPGYTNDETLVTAQGPNGSSAEKNNEEQQQQQEQSTTFTQAEQVGGDGVPDAIIPLADTPPVIDPNAATLAAIANYAAANAEGVYDLSDFATTGVQNTGSGSGSASGYTSKLTGGTIWANFQPAQVEAYFNVEAQQGSGPIYSGYISASGGIAGTGLTLAGTGSMYNNLSETDLCSTCQFQATGLFKGPTAQIIGINYNINGFTTGNVIPGGDIKGTAGFYAPNILPPDPNAATLNAIASYAAAIAEGVYYLDTAFAQTSTLTKNNDGNVISDVKIKEGSHFKVEFGPRIITAFIDVSAHQSYSGGSTISGSFNGSSPMGGGGTGFGFTASGGGGLCSSCTLTANGLFSGPTAQKASIEYFISGFNPSGKGKAGFYAPSVPASGGGS